MNSECSLESYVYPIKGTIEFQLDEIKSLSSSERFSQPVKIGKTKWCIETMVEWNILENKACLKVNLANLHKFDDEGFIECKFKFRILSKDETAHFTSGSDLAVFDKNTYNWAPDEDLGMTSLLNDGFLTDGALKIECDVGIVYENIHGSVLPLPERRPNDDDIEMMLAVSDFQTKRKLIEMEIELAEIIPNPVSSHIVYIDGVPCRIKAQYVDWNSEEWLGLHLSCNSNDESEWWGVEATAEFRVVNRINKSNNFCESLSFKKFTRERISWGYDRFVEWSELTSEEKGFVEHGRVLIEAYVSIHNKYGFDQRTGKGILAPMKKLTDAEIILNEEHFYVSRMILSHQSGWFCDSFSKDPEKHEFVISDVSEALFEKFLRLVYNVHTEWKEEEVLKMLDLLEKYKADECITRLDNQIRELEMSDDMKMLMLVDKHSLPNLKARYVQKLQNLNELRKIFQHTDVGLLSDKLRRDLTSDTNLKQEVGDDEPFYVYSKELESKEKISEPREKLQKFLSENNDAKKLLEDPAIQNIGNSVLTFLAEKKESGICQISFKEFSDPTDMVTFNFKDNKMFYSSKQILANASHHFMKRYFGPETTDEDNTIIFDEITSEDFNLLMNHVYHPTKPVSSQNLDVLLTLSHRFTFFDVSSKCEDYLMKNSGMTVSAREEYAKKYDLKILLNACNNYKEPL